MLYCCWGPLTSTLFTQSCQSILKNLIGALTKPDQHFSVQIPTQQTPFLVNNEMVIPLHYIYCNTWFRRDLCDRCVLHICYTCGGKSQPHLNAPPGSASGVWKLPGSAVSVGIFHARFVHFAHFRRLKWLEDIETFCSSSTMAEQNGSVRYQEVCPTFWQAGRRLMALAANTRRLRRLGSWKRLNICYRSAWKEGRWWRHHQTWDKP